MTVYDAVDWHVKAALDAGQPEQRAFTHIALYLGWLARNDMTSPAVVRRDWVDAIKSGDMTGLELLSAVDGVLVTEMLTAEGRAFTDAYYQHFLTDYEEAFSGSGDYGVGDDENTRAVIVPLIDRRYEEWVAAGRPAGTRGTEARSAPPAIEALAERAGVSPGELAAHRLQVTAAVADLRLGAPPTFLSSRPLRLATPAAQELEMIATAVADEAPELLASQSADEWGDPLLERALKRLGVAPKSVTVTAAMWSHRTVFLYKLPGADPSVAVEELSTAIQLPPGAVAEEALIGAKRVRMGRGSDFAVAYWPAPNNLVVHVAVTDIATLEQVVGRLP